MHTWVGQLHRNLHLGEVGRLYSELAASWLGVIALFGLILWVQRIRKTRKARGPSTRPQNHGAAETLSLHSAAGVWLALGFFFLSATGLTWSTYAGANVTDLRAAIGWSTPPSPPTSAPPAPAAQVAPVVSMPSTVGTLLRAPSRKENQG
ncbi:hypothetical protein MN0502_35320 (plasmid) [Arthrobacter sp. MN05-02]|nr:hypothetical protein MN0502_35320 [Arthrobacter sp. MN05-02]